MDRSGSSAIKKCWDLQYYNVWLRVLTLPSLQMPAIPKTTGKKAGNNVLRLKRDDGDGKMPAVAKRLRTA